jgi:prophage regulatory protein
MLVVIGRPQMTRRNRPERPRKRSHVQQSSATGPSRPVHQGNGGNLRLESRHAVSANGRRQVGDPENWRPAACSRSRDRRPFERGRKMTANENLAPRTNVATSFNVAPRVLKNCCDMPNNPNPFGALSETGHIRQSQLIPTIFPFSSATLWRKVKSGTFSQPAKLGPRITACRVEDIRSLIERLGR